MEYRQKRWELAGAVALALLTGYLLYTSWLRWPDAGVDFGFFLFNAWRVSEGGLPGSSFPYYYGPAALLFYGGLFRLFGASVWLVYGVNFLLLLANTSLLYLFFRAFSRTTAFLAALTFLGVFALGQYIFQANYNFIAPYKPEIAFGMPLLFLQAFLSLRLARSPTVGRALAMGSLSGLLLLTSTEIALASLGALLLLFLSIRPGAKALLGAGSGFMFFPLLATIYLPVDSALQAVLVLGQKSLVLDPALQELMGADRPLWRAFVVARSFLVFSLAGALYLLLGKQIASSRARRWGSLALALALPFLVFAGGFELPLWLYFPKLLVVFPLAGFFLWLTDRKKHLALGLWSVLAGFLLLRMAGNAMFHYYGFSLSLGATLLLFPLLREVIPSYLARWGWPGLGLRSYAWGIALTLLATALLLREPFFAHKGFAINQGRDPLYDWDPAFSPRGKALQELLAELSSRRHPGDLVLGLPDGHIVNYLLRAPRPRMSLSLGEIKEFGEKKIVESYAEERPRFVFLMEKEAYDDQGGFGSAYGQEVLRWLQKNYQPVQTFGDPLKVTLYEIR